MIRGRIADGKATVPVIFRLPEQPDFSLNFVIDTGFNGYSPYQYKPLMP